jgi:hypothetical protein
MLTIVLIFLGIDIVLDAYLIYRSYKPQELIISKINDKTSDMHKVSGIHRVNTGIKTDTGKEITQIYSGPRVVTLNDEHDERAEILNRMTGKSIAS